MISLYRTEDGEIKAENSDDLNGIKHNSIIEEFDDTSFYRSFF